jgi:hypothetical protein
MDFHIDADLLKELHKLSTTESNEQKVREAADDALMEILAALRDDAILEQNEEDDED